MWKPWKCWETLSAVTLKKTAVYTMLSLSIVAIDLNINTTAEHSWFEDHALYLVGPKESCLLCCWNLAIPLRAIGIGYNWFVWAMHCEKNSRNTSKDMIKLFFFMTTLGLMSLKKCRKKIFENAQMGCFTSPAVFSGHCSFWLLVVPKDAASHWFISFANRKLASKLNRLQRRFIFLGWISKIAWEKK